MEGAGRQQGLQGQALARGICDRELCTNIILQTVPPWHLVLWEALREHPGSEECVCDHGAAVAHKR